MTSEKNLRIREAILATRVKRSTQVPVTRELKLTDSKITKLQKEALRLAFLEAKWLYNHLLTTQSWSTFDYKARTVPVRLPNGAFEERELHLGSQVKQKIGKQIESSLKTLATLKKKGKKVGALKPISECSSIPFSQAGVTWKLQGSKLRLQGLPGAYRVRGSEQLKGLELANAKLVKRASGYYFLVTGYREPEEKKAAEKAIGLDFGIKAHITTSEGVEYSTLVSEPERLKRLQRKLQRQVKDSKNRSKTVVLLRKEYEKLSHRKDDLANKIVHTLLSENDLIVLQDENLRGWKTRYGKTLQHSILGRVKTKLSTSSQAVVVERFAPSTQYCPECSSLNKLALSERTYSCACGYYAPRDVHAAQNMLRFGGVSPVGRRVVPVDWRTAVASSASDKSSQVEAGNEIAYEKSGSTGSYAAVETRLSLAVA